MSRVVKVGQDWVSVNGQLRMLDDDADCDTLFEGKPSSNWTEEDFQRAYLAWERGDAPKLNMIFDNEYWGIYPTPLMPSVKTKPKETTKTGIGNSTYDYTKKGKELAQVEVDKSKPYWFVEEPYGLVAHPVPPSTASRGLCRCVGPDGDECTENSDNHAGLCHAYRNKDTHWYYSVQDGNCQHGYTKPIGVIKKEE